MDEMKKTILLLGSALALVLVAVYVTNHYSISEPELPTVHASDIIEDLPDNGPLNAGDTQMGTVKDGTSAGTDSRRDDMTDGSTGGSDTEPTLPATHKDELVQNDTGEQPVSKGAVGELAPPFTLKGLDGESVSLQDLQGQPIYLNFWATWCKWCVKEMPEMEKVFVEYQERGLVLLAVSVGEDLAKVENYLEDQSYSFQFLLDTDKSVTRSYGLKSIPVSIMIDRNGYVIYKRVGAMNEQQIRSAVELLFAE